MTQALIEIEEERLAELLFGPSNWLTKFNSDSNDTTFSQKHVADKPIDSSSNREYDLNEEPLSWSIDTEQDALHPNLSVDSAADTTATTENHEHSEIVSKKHPAPAWSDHQEDVSVDIASVRRARKLRKTRSESTISVSEYEDRLRAFYTKNNTNIPKWATIPLSSTNDDSDGKQAGDFKDEQTTLSFACLASALSISVKSKFSGSHSIATLDSDNIYITRLKDANLPAYSNAVIQSTRFHPTAPVVLTAGFDKMLRLFQVNSKSTALLSGIQIQQFPIHSAEFSPDGRSIILTSRKRCFYVFDLPTGSLKRINQIKGCTEKSFEKMKMCPDGRYMAFIGDHGSIHLVSMISKQYCTTLKMNNQVVDLCFSSDGKYCYSIGSDSHIYQWNMQTFQCEATYLDYSLVHSTTIGLSPDGKFMAVGTKSGFVNIYSVDSSFKKRESDNQSSILIHPIKCISNLVTSIHIIAFHPSSSLMVISSRRKKDALKIVHLPSFRVYPNWPTAETPLSYVNSVDFSPDGGYIVIGNDKGKVLMYEINSITKQKAS